VTDELLPVRSRGSYPSHNGHVMGSTRHNAIFCITCMNDLGLEQGPAEILDRWIHLEIEEDEVPRADVEYVVYRARDFIERGQEMDAWRLLDEMTRRIGRSKAGPNMKPGE